MKTATQKNHAVDKTKVQVFLYTCPGNIPFNFASHPWFVINERGTISRWEILFKKPRKGSDWGHIFRDYFPPFSGIEIVPFWKKFLWRGRLIGKIEEDPAQQIANFIKNSPNTYPHKNRYSSIGPNSNTYVQWILNNFPEFQTKLPKNAFGKNYR